MESQLFGHRRGSFTGAVDHRNGVFALAHTGTLFIDEISELALPLQAKLLRVIQAHEFVKVGGSKLIRTDIRLITASNKALREAWRSVDTGSSRAQNSSFTHLGNVRNRTVTLAALVKKKAGARAGRCPQPEGRAPRRALRASPGGFRERARASPGVVSGFAETAAGPIGRSLWPPLGDTLPGSGRDPAEPSGSAPPSGSGCSRRADLAALVDLRSRGAANR
jgi:hypothetical protein